MSLWMSFCGRLFVVKRNASFCQCLVPTMCLSVSKFWYFSSGSQKSLPGLLYTHTPQNLIWCLIVEFFLVLNMYEIFVTECLATTNHSILSRRVDPNILFSQNLMFKTTKKASTPLYCSLVTNCNNSLFNIIVIVFYCPFSLPLYCPLFSIDIFWYPLVSSNFSSYKKPNIIKERFFLVN